MLGKKEEKERVEEPAGGGPKTLEALVLSHVAKMSSRKTLSRRGHIASKKTSKTWAKRVYLKHPEFHRFPGHRYSRCGEKDAWAGLCR
jgi:hypothetical protein